MDATAAAAASACSRCGRSYTGTDRNGEKECGRRRYYTKRSCAPMCSTLLSLFLFYLFMSMILIHLRDTRNHPQDSSFKPCDLQLFSIHRPPSSTSFSPFSFMPYTFSFLLSIFYLSFPLLLIFIVQCASAWLLLHLFLFSSFF